MIKRIFSLVVLVFILGCLLVPFTACGEDTQYAHIEIENYGTIVFELRPDQAPETVANFIKLAESGFYNGLTFHRIMEGFMMQGGCPNGDGSGDSGTEIVGEFSANGYNNTLSHVRGTVSMARGGHPYYDSYFYNTGSSQFFIVHKDSPSLDGKYAAFGTVVEGMDIVDRICTEAKPTDNNGTIPKGQQPVIKSITISDSY